MKMVYWHFVSLFHLDTLFWDNVWICVSTLREGICQEEILTGLLHLSVWTMCHMEHLINYVTYGAPDIWIKTFACLLHGPPFGLPFKSTRWPDSREIRKTSHFSNLRRNVLVLLNCGGLNDLHSFSNLHSLIKVVSARVKWKTQNRLLCR